MDLYLAQLLGLYFIIFGVIIFVRRKSFMPAIAQLAANRPVLISLAAVELAAGLALVLVYPSVSFSVEGIFSVVGYMLIIESVIYAAAPARSVQRMIRSFNTPQWYLSGAFLAVITGAYLAFVGFGLV